MAVSLVSIVIDPTEGALTVGMAITETDKLLLIDLVVPELSVQVQVIEKVLVPVVPKKTSLELFGLIERRIANCLPIILTTGFSGFMTEEKVRELGFRELLNKPSTIQTLGEAVHRVLHPATSVG